MSKKKNIYIFDMQKKLFNFFFASAKWYMNIFKLCRRFADIKISRTTSLVYINF